MTWNSLSGLFKKKKVALVLGGGSARGLAHIGVIKVFERENIKFDMVIGTSIGALVGGYYALTGNVSGAEHFAHDFKVNENLDIMLPPTLGLIKGNRIYEVLKKLFQDKTFNDTKVPFAAVCADIENAEEVVFREGLLRDAVRISCSYPGIFIPQRVNGRLLVDGGLLNTVPVNVARQMGADFVLAVDVGFCVQKGELKSIFGVILQTYQIMGNELNKHQSKQADIIIKPNLRGIDQLAFDKSHILILSGENAALERLDEIKKRLKIT